MMFKHQCNDCGGGGSICAACGEIPDNCNCEPCDEQECEKCNGNGFIENDDPCEENDE